MLTSSAIVVDAVSVSPESGGVGTVACGVIAGLLDGGAPVRVRVSSTSHDAWEAALGDRPGLEMEPVSVRLAAGSRWQNALRRILPPALRRSAAVGVVRRLRAKSLPSLGDAVVWVPFHRVPLAAERGVVTVHDLRVFGDADFSPMDQRIIAENVEKATAVVCSWPHPTQHLLQLFPQAAHKTFTVPLPLLEPGEPVDRALPVDGEIRVLVPGFVTPHKNQEVLLRALPHLPSVRLVVTGSEDGTYARRLRELAAELGVVDRVDWRGRVTRGELAEEYDRAHVLAMPTRWEAASGPVFEAIARELPFIASDIAPIRAQLDSIDVTGELFDPDDPMAVAGALRRVTASYDAARASLRAPGQRLRERTWRETADDYRRVLDWARGVGAKPTDLQTGATA